MLGYTTRLAEEGAMYRSYSYLTEGRDYRTFAFPPEVGRVSSTQPSTTSEQEERVRRLMRDHLMISLHDHPTLVPANIFELPELIRQGRDFTGYDGLLASGQTGSVPHRVTL